VELSTDSRTKLQQVLTVNPTVEITGQAEPISRPEKPPVPEAVPPENVEKKKRQRSRKKPAEEGPKGINFVEGTTLDDGLLAKATKEGEGFLAALSLFRNSEKVDERQDEMDALDPRKREEQKAKYAEEDRAAKEKNKPNFKIKKKVVAAPKTFGVPLAKLEKADLEDGQTVPKVLQLLSKWIQANGGLGMPSLFTPEPAADIGKECKDVRARLDQLDYTPCTNPRVCAQLMLEWCRDFPGGLLAGLPDGLLSELEDGEAAIEAIGQLPEEVQDVMTLIVETAHKSSAACGLKQGSSTPAGVGDDAETLAEAFAGYFGPVDQQDTAQFFIYLLLDYWAENT